MAQIKMESFFITENKILVEEFFVWTKHFSHILTVIIFELIFLWVTKQEVVDF